MYQEFTKTKTKTATERGNVTESRSHSKSRSNPKNETNKSNIMQKTLLFIFAFCVCVTNVFAQPPSAAPSHSYHFILYLILLIIAVIVFLRNLKVWKSDDKKVEEFEYQMKKNGFMQRKVVLDFTKRWIERGFKKYWAVGIWLNYEKRLIALRLNADDWEKIIIPFNEIRSVEIIRKVCTKVDRGGIFNSAELKETIEKLQVRIVKGNANGTRAYILNLYDSAFPRGARPDYEAIRECARSIEDEINNI